MRMIYRSSDVCSSDLSPRPWRSCWSASSTASRTRNCRCGTSRCVPRCTNPATDVDLVPHPHARRRTGHERQNGREECRERECKYVLISEVAVSSKKKNKQTIMQKETKIIKQIQ